MVPYYLGVLRNIFKSLVTIIPKKQLIIIFARGLRSV